jgi:hypothetical protein
MINGEWGTSSKPYELVEPETGFCDDITVEVWIGNVEDLYGYEFKLTWDTTFFALKSWVVAPVWPSQYVVKPDATYTGTSPYHQVVVAMAPSTGVSGNILLATLTFHIVNDVCWLQGNLTKVFKLKDYKASDSCSQEIELCTPKHGYVKLVPVQPRVYLDPAKEVNWVVGDKYTLTVWAENVVKLKDVEIYVTWSSRYDTDWGIYSPILYTTDKDVVVNGDVFPKAKRIVDILTVTSSKCGNYSTPQDGEVYLKIVMADTYPLINGTFWIMKITFTKCDPWYCGRQPGYTRTGEHGWICENATTNIDITGKFSVKCPDDADMLFGTDVIVEPAMFTFMPIPGDLDGSGHVDIADLIIIAGKYGSTKAFDLLEYDLTGDGRIDIFDIVVVAKNICRTSPF